MESLLFKEKQCFRLDKIFFNWAAKKAPGLLEAKCIPLLIKAEKETCSDAAGFKIAKAKGQRGMKRLLGCSYGNKRAVAFLFGGSHV